MKIQPISYGIILILLFLNLNPITSSIESTDSDKISYDEGGTLSGFIKDQNMNPVEEAKIRVYFHEFYEENFSDSSGYYHVTNIPLCNCTKNATITKFGYISDSVLLTINETTRHDFILERYIKTLHVGGTGPNNYSTIQEGINNAKDGFTVFVHNGIYSDYFPDNLACVKVTKSINLIGEDKNNTIINGPGYQRVLYIDAEKVNVSGFTVKHGDIPKPDGWIIGVDVHNNKKDIQIFDNIIINNDMGLYIEQYSKNVIVRDNIIMNNRNGIETSINCLGIEIFDNIISNNNKGILSGEGEINFYRNLVSNNTIGISSGSTYNINNNQIRDNEIGIKIYSSDSIIEYNNFINNDNHAYVHKGFFLLQGLNTKSCSWNSNYWDDWTNKIVKRRPIRGDMNVYMRVIIIIPKLIIIQIKIAEIPYFEYDISPVSEPYEPPIPEVNI